MKNNKKYQDFCQHLRKITDIRHAIDVMSWDHQTYMPKNGAEARGQQVATLESVAHTLWLDEKFGVLLKELSEDSSLGANELANVRLVLRDYTRKKKYTLEFVDEMSRATSAGFSAWHEAKVKKDFSIFEPVLKKIVELKRQECEFLGYEDHPYNALLVDFEPGLTVKKVDEVFTDVKAQLFPFTKEVFKRAKPNREFLHMKYSKAKQLEFSEKKIKQMGYSFDGGRADFAPHPFCTTFGPGDVRITLWVDEEFFNPMFFAAVHEAGHALYEMGLPSKENYGLPAGEAISMAFHESQSRFWENCIARSRPYWEGSFKELQKEFPENLSSVSVEEFYKGVNYVEPSFVRVEADELTYHAHIYIRYLIEKALITNEIQVSDVPKFWNDRYEEFLGIRPENDAEGCLQDVHWSYGSFGYFPTYSLGSFISAQLLATMKKDISGFDDLVRSGNLTPIRQWLNTNVHSHGRLLTSNELLKRVTGSELQFKFFMDYAREKYGKIYGI